MCLVCQTLTHSCMSCDVNLPSPPLSGLVTAGAGMDMAANLAGPNFFRPDQTAAASNPYVGPYSTQSGVVRNDPMGAYSRYASRFRNPYFGGGA